MYHCFVCGKAVVEGQKALFLTTEFGIVYNAIHEECYDLDDRDYLDIEEAKECAKNVGE